MVSLELLISTLIKSNAEEKISAHGKYITRKLNDRVEKIWIHLAKS